MPLVDGESDLVGASLIVGDALFLVSDGDMLDAVIDVGDKLDVGLWLLVCLELGA